MICAANLSVPVATCPQALQRSRGRKHVVADRAGEVVRASFVSAAQTVLLGTRTVSTARGDNHDGAERSTIHQPRRNH